MNTAQRKYLEKAFDTRVNFRKTERKLYGHDIAAVPALIKPLIGSTIPDAVVQPENETELAELVRWATENNIPLTPRGKATSGYGGVLPVKKGIVVDFYRMKKVIGVDEVNQTVTVQAGAVFEKLDRELARYGLTLRLYPSSYPAATVGGWLAQGGAGIGSFEAGWFQDNVLSARVVMPGGEVKEFRGDDINLIAEAEGITGFISEVTLRVQPLEELDVVAIGCPEVAGLQKMSQAFVEKKLPIWSMLFINPKMAEMKNEAPLREHLGHAAEEKVNLPSSYITT
ncbi:MAG: FAD-binding oxidoreductase, partial [Dehalococcoidales bacterium]|nr:FAD-binding oxidoreductase [Dehalococcoidales bacterium]